MALGFLRLALGAARLFVLPFHQLGPLSAAFGERRLSWSSDDFLLGMRSCHQDVEKGPQLRSRSAQSLNVLGTRCSARCNVFTASRSLRPCWVTFLNILNGLD